MQQAPAAGRHSLPPFCPAAGSKDFRTAPSLILPTHMPRAHCAPSIDTRSSCQRARSWRSWTQPTGGWPDDDARLARVEQARWPPPSCLGRPLAPPRDLFALHRGHPQPPHARGQARIDRGTRFGGVGRPPAGWWYAAPPARIRHLVVPAHGELVALGPAQAAPMTRRAVNLGRATASRGPDQANWDAGFVWRRRADGLWPGRRVVGAGWMAAGGRGARATHACDETTAAQHTRAAA